MYVEPGSSCQTNLGLGLEFWCMLDLALHVRPIAGEHRSSDDGACLLWQLWWPERRKGPSQLLVPSLVDTRVRIVRGSVWFHPKSRLDHVLDGRNHVLGVHAGCSGGCSGFRVQILGVVGLVLKAAAAAVVDLGFRFLGLWDWCSRLQRRL